MHRKGSRRTFIHGIAALGLAAVLGAGSVLGVSASSLSELEQKQQQTQEQIDQNKKESSDLQSSKDAVEAKIDTANDQLTATIASIDETQKELDDLADEIEKKKEELADARATEQKQYDAMEQRLQFLYEKGDDAALEALIGAKDFSDLLNKGQFADSVYDYDQKMLEQYAKARDDVSTAKEELENDKAEQQTQQQELKEQKASLDSQLEEMKAQDADYEQKLAAAQKKAQELAAQYADQAAQIQAIKDAASQDAAVQAAALAAEQGDGQHIIEPSGNSGIDVVKFASQFVGNRYVWGGTSLTNGTDCSGFTMSVYRHFGYSLPRTAEAQLASAGRSIPSLAQAQPGDLICYGGHVAIYIGDGKIVHAANARKGIIISGCGYRQILGIKRILN